MSKSVGPVFEIDGHIIEPVTLDRSWNTTTVNQLLGLPGMFSTFDKPQLRNLRIIAITASVLSIIAGVLGLHFFTGIHRSRRVFRHYLIFYLVVCDFLKALVLMIYPIIILIRNDIYGIPAFYNTLGWLTLFAIEGADIAIAIFAVHFAILIFRPNWKRLNHKTGNIEGGLFPVRHFLYAVTLVVPAILASLAFVNFDKFWPVNLNDHVVLDNNNFGFTYQGRVGGYKALSAWCFLPPVPYWYRLVLSWGPKYFIIILIFTVYISIYVYVSKENRKIKSQLGEFRGGLNSIDIHRETDSKGRLLTVRQKLVLYLKFGFRKSGLKFFLDGLERFLSMTLVDDHEEKLGVRGEKKGNGRAHTAGLTPARSANSFIEDEFREHGFSAPPTGIKSVTSQSNDYQNIFSDTHLIAEHNLGPREPHENIFDSPLTVSPWSKSKSIAPTPHHVASNIGKTQLEFERQPEHGVVDPTDSPEGKRQAKLSGPRRKSHSAQDFFPNQQPRSQEDLLPFEANTIMIGDAFRENENEDAWLHGNNANTEAVSSLKEATKSVNPNHLLDLKQNFQFDTYQNFKNRRSVIQKQLRSIFIYPFSYIVIWTFPLVVDCIQYRYEIVHGPVVWLEYIATFMQPLSCVVDVMVFLYREKPWRYSWKAVTTKELINIYGLKGEIGEEEIRKLCFSNSGRKGWYYRGRWSKANCWRHKPQRWKRMVWILFRCIKGFVNKNYTFEDNCNDMAYWDDYYSGKDITNGRLSRDTSCTCALKEIINAPDSRGESNISSSTDEGILESFKRPYVPRYWKLLHLLPMSHGIDLDELDRYLRLNNKCNPYEIPGLQIALNTSTEHTRANDENIIFKPGYELSERNSKKWLQPSNTSQSSPGTPKSKYSLGNSASGILAESNSGHEMHELKKNNNGTKHKSELESSENDEDGSSSKELDLMDFLKN
ncbi:LAMI_0H19460g1_1 [Lachancea mirantina]|uniref:LAMI_0H19460g1_1 n=1 Tax=Lachancea mirantina TaxID=1230905 RepID=A0A1G4KK11_9SACH|nr:LAMI_0H19460g1_1 [Lachancea mirantina]